MHCALFLEFDGNVTFLFLSSTTQRDVLCETDRSPLYIAVF